MQKWNTCLSPAHTMRFSSFVGRRDDEKTKIAWCENIKDDCLSLILPTRQLLDRFDVRIGPTTVVAWCERDKDIRRINRGVRGLSVECSRVCGTHGHRVVLMFLTDSPCDKPCTYGKLIEGGLVLPLLADVGFVFAFCFGTTSAHSV